MLASVSTPAGTGSLNKDVGPDTNHRSPSAAAFSTAGFTTAPLAFGTCWPSLTTSIHLNHPCHRENSFQDRTRARGAE